MKFWIVVCVVFLFTAGETFAQSDRAIISGTVKDASGALIAGAQVGATNVGDDTESSTTTDAVGRFTLLNLPVGQYTLTCSKDGFEKYQRSGLTLAISETTEIDIPEQFRRQFLTPIFPL